MEGGNPSIQAAGAYRQVFGGALLVAGTSIGAGMLALPVVTGLGGFYPSLLIYFLCWLFMSATGLLMLEICLRMPPDANLVSMAGAYLGRGGKAAAWILYLFLFYCLSVAYLSGGGQLLRDWLLLPTEWSGPLFFLLILAPFVYAGAKMVDRINFLFMGGLIGTYLLFVFYGMPHVDLSLLAATNWESALYALPVIFTSFSYQGIIPSLTAYMRRDPKKLRVAILMGTSLAFCIYLLWEWLILGIVPTEGLESARLAGQTAVHPLRKQLPNSPVVAIGQAFAFFAIITSYLGVTLGLFDFLADGLRVAKIGVRRFALAALTFIPPLFIALSYPGAFISALIYAGGIGCALLLGLIPILMAWVSRSRKEEGPILLPGGKPMLAILLLFALIEVGMELYRS